MGIRPSELWGIAWPLAAFFFDRGVRDWANFVDRNVKNAEAEVRMRMRNSKRANVDSFAHQAAQVTFNKLMGLSTENLYAAPTNVKGATKESRSNGERPKIDLDKIPGMPRLYR